MESQQEFEKVASVSVEEFKQKLTIIESEFSVDWLSTQLKKGKHPAPLIWKALKDFIESQGNLSLPIFLELNELTDDIGYCRSIPNYESEVKPRLFSCAKYHDAKYEMSVARLFKSVFERVEFIPIAPEKRTADLVVFHKDSPIFIECTRTKPLKGSNSSYYKKAGGKKGIGEGARFLKRLKGAIKDHNGSLDVFVILLQTKLIGQISENLIIKLKELVSAGFRGVFIKDDFAYALSIQNSPVIPDGENLSLKIPLVLNPGSVEGVIAEEKDGQKHIKNIKRCGIYNLDALQINAALKRFGRKFKKQQTQGCMPGIIFMDLDFSKLDQNDTKLYIKLLSIVLTLYFKKGYGQEIGGVGITHPSILSPVPQKDNSYIFLRRTSYFVPNPNNSLPHSFPIPGKILTV